MVKPKYQPALLQQNNKPPVRELVLFNDETNTFEFVIQTLIEICDHQPEQAEQCALIAHFNGKCSVKSGDYHFIKPLAEEMSIRGLTVAIE